MVAISEAIGYKARLLCIDNDGQALALRTSVLEAEGYCVFAALGGEAAVRLFASEQIDLVLSGLVFPGVSGAELSIFMRQVRPEVPVVLVSRTERVPAALLRQVDGFVQHSAPTKDLLTCIEEVLWRRTEGQQRRPAPYDQEVA
jgi:DNA-binding NtrC family response regulator